MAAPERADAREADQRPGHFRVTGLATRHAAGKRAPSKSRRTTCSTIHERQLWYCDIEIKAGAAYFPFIRLALARYQPTSSKHAHLSNVVLADIMALTPDRWLNVTPTAEPATRQVAVFGVRPYESSGHHEAAQSAAVSLVGLSGEVELLQPVTIAESTVVDCGSKSWTIGSAKTSAGRVSPACR